MTLPMIVQNGFQGVGWHKSVIRLSRPIPWDTFVSHVLPALEQAPGFDGSDGVLWGIFVQGQRDASGNTVPAGPSPAVLSPSAEVEQQIASGQILACFLPWKCACYYSAPHQGVVALWVYAYNADPMAAANEPALLTQDGGVAFLDPQAAASLSSSAQGEDPAWQQQASPSGGDGWPELEGWSLGSAPPPVAPQSISDRTLSALDWAGKQIGASSGSSLRAWATENPGTWQALYVTGTLVAGAAAVAAGGWALGALGAKYLGAAVGLSKVFPWAATLLRYTALAGVVASLNFEAVTAFGTGYSTLTAGGNSSAAQLWSRLGVAAREGKERVDQAVQSFGEGIDSVSRRFKQMSRFLSAIGGWGQILLGGVVLFGLAWLVSKKR